MMNKKRVLFVSSYFPSNLRTLVHGTFKRMEMFIDALKAVARLDMLFYVRPDQDVSPGAIAALERSFS
ncbi:MAG: glycosyltransferase, partial [Nitrospinota bacterium]